MRAAVLRVAGGELAVETVPDPVAGPGEALVRVRACGIGLTLAWNRDGRGKPGRLPRVIGHEIAGEVVAVGSGAGERGGVTVVPGDRVAAYYYLTCGTCPRCALGRENLCERRAGVVGREIDGGLAELVALPRRNLVPVPTGVGFVEAAVAADAIATPLHVLRDRAAVQPGETVLVVGAGGGVGIHAVQVARWLGATVIAADITPAKLDLAMDNGASAGIDASVETLDEGVARVTGGRGVDVVVDFVGRTGTMAQAVASLGSSGRLVLVGTYDRDAVLPIRHATLRGDSAILASQYCTRSDVADALGLAAIRAVQPVVSRTGTLEEAGDLLRAVEAMAVAGRAAVVFDAAASS